MCVSLSTSFTSSASEMDQHKLFWQKLTEKTRRKKKEGLSRSRVSLESKSLIEFKLSVDRDAHSTDLTRRVINEITFGY